MDMYSSNSGVPGLAATPSLSYSALHDPLALPDFCDFEGKNDLMDCGFGFNFPELNSFGGLDLDKLDQLVRMEADLERIERLERLEVEVGSLDSEGEVAYPPNLIGPSLGLSGWAPSDSSVESSLSHGCSVAAAMDSDSTDVVVNPLSVLPVSSSSSLNGGWSALLQQQQQQPQQQVAQAQTVNVSSTMPASPAPQGSPVSFPQRVAKSAPSSQSSSASAEPASGYPKPAYSYSCLIALALKNSRTGCLPVSEIYRFMCEHFPYFRTAPAGWKNSVRHNLSLNKCFEKVEKVSTTNGGGASNGGAQTNNTSASTRKGCLWTLSAAKAAKMDEEVLKWSRKDPIAIKRAMAYPDALELLERGEMKMDSVGGASTESEDEGEGPEEEAECHSPLTRVTPPEPSPPFDDVKSSSSSDKEQLNLGVSIVSRLAPPITGRRPSVQGSKQPKVYYSLPKFQTSGSELIIIGDARLESV